MKVMCPRKFNQSILLAVLTLGVLFPTKMLGSEPLIKDSESASHGDSASIHEIVNTYRYDGVEILQLNLAVLSHYSYIVASAKEAIIVDPDRDIQAYIDIAKEKGWTIKGVFLTHSNADFVAGHTEFTELLGCSIYQSKRSGAEYNIISLSDGKKISLGEIVIEFIDTPGHTPDGTSALIFSKNDNLPKAILTGDALFVGSIGRPDLMGGTMSAAALAEMGYETWTKKLSKLDDSVVVLPGHGAGSLCGAHLRDEPSTTIGIEKATNPYLQHKGKNEFITAVLDGLPQAPQYFKHNAKMNRQGPPKVNWDEVAKTVEKPYGAVTNINDYYVVDIREAESFAAGHIPNSVNIALRGRLETWVGIMVPWGSNLILCGTPDEISEAQHRLNRIGYDVKGVITFDDWKNSGLKIYSNKATEPQELYKSMKDGSAPMIVDVRLPTEWMGLRIGDVLNMPLNKLDELTTKLDMAEPVVIVCNSAYRSSMGIGLLERQNFKNVSSLKGGGQAWIEEGLPVIQATASGANSSESKRVINLPDIIDASQLKRMLMDLPGTFDLVDIRPAEYFADYSIPGAQNIDVAELLNNPAYLTGAGSLVLIDRDGTVALAVAGILSQKTERVIKVVFGGLNAYWKNDMGQPVKSISLPSEKMPPIQQIPAKPIPVKPKKRSAGC